MAAKIHVLPVDDTVEQKVVAFLEELLELAKSGEIIQFVGVIVRKDESYQTVASATVDRTKMIGYLFQALFDRSNE